MAVIPLNLYAFYYAHPLLTACPSAVEVVLFHPFIYRSFMTGSKTEVKASFINHKELE